MKVFNIKQLIIAFLMVITSVNSYSQITKAEIIAIGLTCSMCSNAINKQFKSMAGVESVSTDLNTNTFTVNLKKNSLLSPNELKESVEKTGFFIGSMVLTMDLGSVETKDNLKVKKGNGTYVFVNPTDKFISGLVKVKVLNDGFVTKKEYKKSEKSLVKYLGFSSSDNTYLIKVI